VNNALKGNFRSAREIHFQYMEAIELLFAEGNPSGVKAFMNEMNLCKNNLRLPLVPVSKNVHSKIQKFVEDHR
jgi:4-hydroxy-tetrahydrodipicolinate synthase